jgi:hypothetical protein
MDSLEKRRQCWHPSGALTVHPAGILKALIIHRNYNARPKLELDTSNMAGEANGGDVVHIVALRSEDK